jgi:hypothetical protein
VEDGRAVLVGRGVAEAASFKVRAAVEGPSPMSAKTKSQRRMAPAITTATGRPVIRAS